MTHLPSNLPDLLRKHGLKVVEVPGWQTRERPASTGGFAPVGVLCHHTASSSNGQAALPLLLNGRAPSPSEPAGLPGPLCQLSLDRQGVVYVVAAGRANHAGVARPSGTVAGGDGNVLYIGIEAQNRGTGEPWSQAQYDAYVTLCAVLSVEITHNSVNTVRAHKETSTNGKIDPFGPTPFEKTFDMDKFRERVQAAMVKMRAPAPVPAPEPTPLQRFNRRRRTHGKKRPAPLVVRVANCASVSTRPVKATATFARALTTPGKFGLPDVVLFSEMADVRAADVAHEIGGWAVSQHGKLGSPDSGLAIAWRATRAREVADKLLPGTPGTSEGGGIRERPILRVGLEIDHGTPQAWKSGFAAGHAAPARAPLARAAYLKAFEALKVRVLGGDLNVVHRAIARLLGRRVFSVGVLHLIVSRWIPAKGPQPVDHGGDHPGVDVLLWPAE